MAILHRLMGVSFGNTELPRATYGDVVDTVPAEFLLSSAAGVEAEATGVSLGSMTIADVTAATDIDVSVSGTGPTEYRVNGGAWTSTAGVAQLGDQIDVQGTAGASGQTTTHTLTVGGVSASATIAVAEETSNAPITSGLIAGYRFADTGATDISGNNNDLVSTGSPVIADGYVTLTDANYYDTGVVLPADYTVIAILRADSGNGTAAIVGDFDGSSIGMIMFSRTDEQASAVIKALIDGGNANGLSQNTDDTNGVLNWQALRADSTTLELKLDIPSQSVAYSTTLPIGSTLRQSTESVKLGRTNSTYGLGARNRYLVEVLIYDRSLTDAEIVDAYAASVAYADDLGITGI